MKTAATYTHRPWNKAKLVGAESPAPTQRYLGHPGKAPNRGEIYGSGIVQLGYRQQAESLRLNQASCTGRSSWRACVVTSDCDGAENSTSRTI